MNGRRSVAIKFQNATFLWIGSGLSHIGPAPAPLSAIGHAMNTVAEIRRIPTDQLVARAYPGFKATRILEVLDKLAWKSPLILKGPKGAGKTLNIEQWAHTRGAPFLRSFN